MMKKGTLSKLGVLIAGCWLVTGLASSAPPFPVPPAGGLVECAADLALCAGDLDSCDVALDTCTTDLATCDGNLSDCEVYANDLEVQLTECNSALDQCLATAQAFPATGQTTCYNLYASPTPCDGTGQDGEFQTGAELSYIDNGETITDNNTKLEWEKKDNSGGIHDTDNEYTWDEAFDYIDTLNTLSFAGHTDWRLPNVKELHSIVNYEYRDPSVSEAFNTACVEGCTLETCSCISYGRGSYWSSTSIGSEHAPANHRSRAATVGFRFGGLARGDKVLGTLLVRAVRGGQ